MASLFRNREPVKGPKVKTFISSIWTHCLSGEGAWSFLSCLLHEPSILLNDSFQTLSKPSLQITLAGRASILPLWHIVTKKCTMLSGQSSSMMNLWQDTSTKWQLSPVMGSGVSSTPIYSHILQTTKRSKCTHWEHRHFTKLTSLSEYFWPASGILVAVLVLIASYHWIMSLTWECIETWHNVCLLHGLMMWNGVLLLRLPARPYMWTIIWLTARG